MRLKPPHLITILEFRKINLDSQICQKCIFFSIGFCSIFFAFSVIDQIFDAVKMLHCFHFLFAKRRIEWDIFTQIKSFDRSNFASPFWLQIILRFQFLPSYPGMKRAHTLYLLSGAFWCNPKYFETVLIIWPPCQDTSVNFNPFVDPIVRCIKIISISWIRTHNLSIAYLIILRLGMNQEQF